MFNVANWTDKQLDELVDMLRSADCSVVASWLAQNYLCSGSRIMTDPSDTTLRFTVGVDTKTVELSAGVFQHAGYIGQVDSAEIINILDTTSGAWGTGLVSDPGNPRWSIVAIKQNEQLHTVQKRWFVNDTVVPNTYYQADVNTLINKAYYDIVVIHGSPAAIPVIPEPPAGFWTIAEIKVPAGSTSINPTDIYDTATPAGSQKTPPNWLPESRVLRLEFLEQVISTMTNFNVDHDPATGYHRLGGWHLGGALVGGTVTAGALNKLTDGSTLGVGELHGHGTSGAILARAYAGATFAIGPAWKKLQLNVKTYDPSTLWNTGTYEFRAPATGYYLASCFWFGSPMPTQSAYYDAAIYVNGVPFSTARNYMYPSSPGTGVWITDIVQLNVGDTVSFYGQVGYSMTCQQAQAFVAKIA